MTFRVGHVDDVEQIAANNIAMAKASSSADGCDLTQPPVLSNRPAKHLSIHALPDPLTQETEDLELPADTVRKGVLAVLSGTAHATYFLLEQHTDTPQAHIVAQLMITYEWSDWRNGVVW